MRQPSLEKLLAEKQNLETILDHLRDGLIAHDRERRILYFNRAAEAITGYGRDQVLGRDCHEVFGAPFCGKKCAFCQEAPTTWTSVSYPLNITTRQGAPKQVQMSVVGLNDANGALMGVLATFHDVTSLVGLKLWDEEAGGFAGIVGRDPQMVQIFNQIKHLAENSYPVLITGETGTGKELVAAAIHSESRRGGGPFVPVNCGALPEGVVESELFGHVKGAFSGAIRDKKGRFELAHTGTIFLDEVGELSKPVQVKLLRVLENGVFERVGGETPIAVDVRVISATNRDLKQEMAKGRFREDLFYRLNVVPLHLPPLRQRPGDIPLLLSYFLDQEQGPERPACRFAPEALARLQQYPWPGNVRELKNAVHFALARSRGTVLRLNDLPPEISRIPAGRSASRKLDFKSVQRALAQCGGNKVKAAKLLGVGRATLYRFLVSHETVLSQ